MNVLNIFTEYFVLNIFTELNFVKFCVKYIYRVFCIIGIQSLSFMAFTYLIQYNLSKFPPIFNNLYFNQKYKCIHFPNILTKI